MAARLRKTHQEDVRKFYVYQFFCGDKCVYVGKGSGNRFKTQCKKFKGYEGKIIACMFSEQKALDLEKELIFSLCPPFNKAMNDGKGEPWKYKIVPDANNDFYVWCNALGTRQMALRILLSRDWNSLKKFGIDIKELLSKLDPFCEVLRGARC
jgi:hypothetical protein